MKTVDVTPYVDFKNNDNETLPVTMCVCGQRFEPWEFIISIYENTPSECPYCGAKLIFGNAIRVYQIVDEEE